MVYLFWSLRRPFVILDRRARFKGHLISEIKHTRINADSRSVIEFEKFGFSHSGHLDIIVTNISYSGGIFTGEEAELSLMGSF